MNRPLAGLSRWRHSVSRRATVRCARAHDSSLPAHVHTNDPRPIVALAEVVANSVKFVARARAVIPPPGSGWLVDPCSLCRIESMAIANTPAKVATLVAYVASLLASATTGAALRVDGGVVKSAF